MLKQILSLIFPIFCVGCGLPGACICQRCLNKSPLVSSKICRKCMTVLKNDLHKHKCYSNINFSQGHSIYEFSGHIKDIIIYSKYKDNHECLKNLLNKTPQKYFLKPFEQLKKDGAYIQPVPISSRKLKQRGFNQSELIAKKLSSILNIPIINILIKKDTKINQARIHSRELRSKNVKNTFEIKKGFNLEPKNIIIVDDVYTTGETVKEVVRVLLLNIKSLENIRVFTLARKI